MLKINSKKKVNKPANTLKPQFAQKKPLVQPEWNATNSDLDRYRLSKAEQVQKKVSLISKHRYEAKELWLQRQEKLKRGIVDEETQTVLETCLSTKRPPEKNMKNLTYFIKDDTYADYLDQAYEESEEKRLSVMDLHPQEKSEIKEIKTVKTREEKPKGEKKQDLDEGDDFIRKVNESLKDARDFMTKIERYPSITKAKDPERALKTLATAADKENNPTKKKPAVVNTTNLKSSLGNSQNGKRTSNLNSSSGFKETSPQLPKVEEKETYKPKYVVEEPPKEVYAAEEKDNKEDISTYFKSLNQIEDTIKFLEENIIGGGSAAPEKKEYNYELPSMPKANERFGFGFGLDDYKSPAAALENKYRGEDSLEKSAEKEEDSYFKKREASLSHSDIKHHHDHEEELSRDHTNNRHDPDDHEHHDEHDDEQISFALTMKSNDHTERNLDHDHHDDYKPGYASKLFGFDDMISPVATTLQKPFPIALHSPPEYPQTIFENKAIQERTRTQNIKPQSPPKMEVRPQPQAQHHEEEEEEEDEEEFNIERIKGLLQATKLEIEKMNTDKMDSYNNSYKTALEDMDKENMSNNRGGFGTTTYNKFDNPVMGKKIEVVKNDAFVTVKQPFNALWENQRKFLADTRDMYDDDIPAPQTLDIKKQAVAATYSPKKFDDMPLNFRSFRK